MQCTINLKTKPTRAMKRITYLLGIISLIAVLSLSGCNKEEPTPSPLQERITFLKKNNTPWNLGTNGRVMKNGFDVSDQFENFQLNFGEFTYTSQGGVSTAWPASGTWEFENGNPNLIRRNDDTLITVSIVSNQLTLSFSVTGLSGGKIDNVDGGYVFTLE